jgi:hypothetical protein
MDVVLVSNLLVNRYRGAPVSRFPPTAAFFEGATMVRHHLQLRIGGRVGPALHLDQLTFFLLFFLCLICFPLLLFFLSSLLLSFFFLSHVNFPSFCDENLTFF